VLVADFWSSIMDDFLKSGVVVKAVKSRSGNWARLSEKERAIYIPVVDDSTFSLDDFGKIPDSWTRNKYLTRDMVASFPGEHDAIIRYAPTSGPYAGFHYHEMYDGLSTSFDGSILMEESGVLREKILLECKTGKSSNGRQLDANVHERLSFQIMQYLEVATKYPSCSLVVIANGAFSKYRNKYHVNFHVQADRLTCFKWFKMKYLCPPCLEYLPPH